MTEILVNSEPIISYDPARAGIDISAVLVTEKQTITQINDFDAPISFDKFRVLASYDLKGMDYLIQIIELGKIVTKVRQAFRKDPVIVVDVGGNEGLADALRGGLPGVTLCKFVGDMDKEISYHRGFRILNKPVWVTKLSILLEQDRIDIDADLSSAKEIKKQLESFQAEYRKSGSVGYNAGRDAHDDYISCLMLSISDRRRAFAVEMPPAIVHNAPSVKGAYRYGGY